jgi:hypothetical protein
MNITCPLCDGKATKAIYMGFPMKICNNLKCSCVWGIFSYIPVWFPVSPYGEFCFYKYEGNYFFALWNWLKNDE